MGMRMAATHALSRPVALSRHNPWLAFALQVLLVVSVEGSAEIGRGMVAQHSSVEGVANAQLLMRFESAHGLWVEPGWQQFFQQPHHLVGLTLSWDLVKGLCNLLYVAGHPLVTLAFAVWLFASRRSLFSIVRNTLFLTSAFAVVLYEAFPLAPPRLATGLTYQGRPFAFQDTLFALLNPNGRVVGTCIGYDEFAAMPSLHVAWALAVGLTLAWTLRRPLRLLALLYPAAMLFAVVVTGNHYLADGIAAAAVLGISFALSLLLARWWAGRRAASRTACQAYAPHHLPQSRETRATGIAA